MIGNAEVVAAGLEEIDPLKGTETVLLIDSKHFYNPLEEIDPLKGTETLHI